jgi:RNA polymerase sigma-70 factor (ECF subfamily)
MGRVRTTAGERSPEVAEHVAAWDAHANRIYRYCFRRTGDSALAEDLTSLVFLEAWRRRGEVSLSAEAQLPWLYGVATNVLRNQRGSQRRYEAALARLPLAKPEPDFTDLVSDRVAAEQRMRSILAELESLSDVEREVLALWVWEGLTPQEVAASLAIPQLTVRTRLHRARVQLGRLTTADAVANAASEVAHGESR